MKKLLVIGIRKVPVVEEMLDHFRQKMPNTQIDYASYDDMIVSFTNGRMNVHVEVSGCDLADYDFVYFKSVHAHARDLSAALVYYVRAQGKKVNDVRKSLYDGNSKLYSYSVLAENAIAVPDTVFTMPSRLKNSYSLYKEKLGLPFVLKDIHASRGAMNEVIRDQEDFNALIARAEASEEHHYFVGQAFVPNDGDYRVLVFGGKVSLAIHRKRADDSTHLNNTSQGGTAVIVPLSEFPEQVLEDSRRAATSHELGIAGVDMVKDKETGRWYCFEVNESPQITTGSHSHAKWDGLASYLMTELENK